MLYASPAVLGGIPAIKMADQAFMIFLIRTTAVVCAFGFIGALYTYLVSKNYFASSILYRFVLLSLFMPLLILNLSYSDLTFWSFIAIMVAIHSGARVSWFMNPYKTLPDQVEKTKDHAFHQVIIIYGIIFAVI